MAFNMPEVDFSWLGRLPGLAEEARGRSSRTGALSDLDLQSPTSLEKAAKRLFDTGNTANMEVGLRLLSLANARRTSEARYQELDPAAWERLLKATESPERPTEIPSAQGYRPRPLDFDEEGKLVEPAAPAAPGPTAPPFSPSPLPGLPTGINPPVIPGMPGPQSALPVPAPSPSEAILAAAEDQPPAFVPPVATAQLGGPGPVPAPQTMPPTSGVPFLGPPAAAQSAPPPPVLPPAPIPPPEMVPDSDRERARALARRLEQALPLLSRRISGAQAAILQKRYSDALRDAALSPEEKRYREDQYINALMGRPRQSPSDWRLEEKAAPEKRKEADKRASVYIDNEDKADDVLNTIGQAKALMRRPDFMSGTGAQALSQVGSALTNLASLARFYKVPEEFLPSQAWLEKNISNPTAVAQVFNALSNRVVFATLGGLGNQISEGDRKFIKDAFNSLSLVPGGNELLLENMRLIAQRTKVAGRIARTYMGERGNRADRWELENTIKNYADSRPLFIDRKGNLTPAGENITRFLNASPPPSKEPTGQPAPLPASPQRQGGALPPQLGAPQARPTEAGDSAGGQRWRIKSGNRLGWQYPDGHLEWD